MCSIANCEVDIRPNTKSDFGNCDFDSRTVPSSGISSSGTRSQLTPVGHGCDASCAKAKRSTYGFRG